MPFHLYYFLYCLKLKYIKNNYSEFLKKGFKQKLFPNHFLFLGFHMAIKCKAQIFFILPTSSNHMLILESSYYRTTFCHQLLHNRVVMEKGTECISFNRTVLAKKYSALRIKPKYSTLTLCKMQLLLLACITHGGRFHLFFIVFA